MAELPYDDAAYMRGAEVRELRAEIERLRAVNERLERLARAGIYVSIVCGLVGGERFLWTVTACCPDRQAEFDRPYGALDFAQCVDIVEIETRRRGWIGADQR